MQIYSFAKTPKMKILAARFRYAALFLFIFIICFLGGGLIFLKNGGKIISFLGNQMIRINCLAGRIAFLS